MLKLTPEKVPAVLRAMQKRGTWQGVIISPDARLGPDGEGQSPVLYLGLHPGLGYEAHCMALGPESHFVVTSLRLSPPEVRVELGGQGQELWPRELFVPYEVAEQAALHFLRTGRRDPSLKWVGVSALPCKKVRGCPPPDIGRGPCKSFRPLRLARPFAGYAS
jgi:hypothetical protein